MLCNIYSKLQFIRPSIEVQTGQKLNENSHLHDIVWLHTEIHGLIALSVCYTKAKLRLIRVHTYQLNVPIDCHNQPAGYTIK